MTGKPIKTPGYHRYMRGVYFLFGMTFSLIWHSWIWWGIAILFVGIRTMRDIYKEEIKFEEETDAF